MKEIICVVALFLITALETDALTCNLCTGSQESDCARNLTSAYANQTCEIFDRTIISNFSYGHKNLEREVEEEEEYDRMEIQEVCIYMEIIENQFTTSMVLRGCAYVSEGKDICAYAFENYKNLKNCLFCDTDSCN